MTYRVIFTPAAENDLQTSYGYIRRQAPHAASDWIRRARLAAKRLTHHPERCPMAPEGATFDQPIRQMLFGWGNRGIHRFLFLMLEEEKSVYILHVRHGSMLPLSPEE